MPRRFARNFCSPIAKLGFVFLLTNIVLAGGLLQPVSAQDREKARYRLINELRGIRSVLQGSPKLDAAVKKLKKFDNDPEALFVLMVAECKQGNSAGALAYAKRAVASGLPFERILSGPREVLKPLYDDPKFKAWSRDKSNGLLQGPMLGAVTDSSARFWVRTASEAVVQVELTSASAENDQAKIVSEPVSTRADQDFTTTVQVDDLKPDSKYRYVISIDGKKVSESATFRTFPKQGAGGRFTVAFGGGARAVPKHERIWDTIATHHPLAMLMLGDNVYIDDPESPPMHHYCYYRRQSKPEWRRLVASTSMYAIYDDHDFGLDDCVPGPEIESPAWKRKAWEIFTQNWNNPYYGGGVESPGCWFDFYIGDVHFILIDGRYYRDLKGKSMLGPTQKKWLLETLKNSQGAFKVLASDVPWAVGVKPGSRDTWDGFPEEREEIFSTIENNKIEGVLLISADRHRSDLIKIDRPKGYDFYEFQSSRLTNVHTHPVVKSPGHLYGYNKKCSFGLMKFDTTKPNPAMTFSIININGKTKKTLEVTRKQLSFDHAASGAAQ